MSVPSPTHSRTSSPSLSRTLPSNPSFDPDSRVLPSRASAGRRSSSDQVPMPAPLPLEQPATTLRNVRAISLPSRPLHTDCTLLHSMYNPGLCPGPFTLLPTSSNPHPSSSLNEPSPEEPSPDNNPLIAKATELDSTPASWMDKLEEQDTTTHPSSLAVPDFSKSAPRRPKNPPPYPCYPLPGSSSPRNPFPASCAAPAVSAQRRYTCSGSAESSQASPNSLTQNPSNTIIPHQNSAFRRLIPKGHAKKRANTPFEPQGSHPDRDSDEEPSLHNTVISHSPTAPQRASGFNSIDPCQSPATLPCAAFTIPPMQSTHSHDTASVTTDSAYQFNTIPQPRPPSRASLAAGLHFPSNFQRLTAQHLAAERRKNQGPTPPVTHLPPALSQLETVPQHMINTSTSSSNQAPSLRANPVHFDDVTAAYLGDDEENSPHSVAPRAAPRISHDENTSPAGTAAQTQVSSGAHPHQPASTLPKPKQKDPSCKCCIVM